MRYVKWEGLGQKEQKSRWLKGGECHESRSKWAICKYMKKSKKMVCVGAALLFCMLCLAEIALSGYGVARLAFADISCDSIPKTPPYMLQKEPPYTVVVDAGHGSTDIGAEGLIKEIKLCEGTSDALCAWLAKDANYKVICTRKQGEDPSSEQRAHVATENEASLFFSIHANCDKTTSQSHGFECFPTPPGRLYSAESMRIALCVASAMKNAGHRLRGDNGVRFAYYSGKAKRIVDSSDDKVRTQKSFGVLEKTFCPSLLVEQCFITNYGDVKIWASDEGCARAGLIYYKAICEYFGTEPIC